MIVLKRFVVRHPSAGVQKVHGLDQVAVVPLHDTTHTTHTVRSQPELRRRLDDNERLFHIAVIVTVSNETMAIAGVHPRALQVDCEDTYRDERLDVADEHALRHFDHDGRFAGHPSKVIRDLH